MLNLKVGCLFTGHRRHHLCLIATFRCLMLDGRQIKTKTCKKKTFLSNQPTASFYTHNSLVFSKQKQKTKTIISVFLAFPRILNFSFLQGIFFRPLSVFSFLQVLMFSFLPFFLFFTFT